MSALTVRPPDRLPPTVGIDRLFESYQQRYNDGDAAAVADLYAVDARWLAASGIVLDGRPAIEAALTWFMESVPPRLALIEQDRFVLGERAVSRGVYVLASDDGSARMLSGGYLTVLARLEDDWQIVSQQMNYLAPMTAEMWAGQVEVLEALSAASPADDAGDTPRAARIAPIGEALYGATPAFEDLLTSDVCASLPGSGWEIGREAVADQLVAARRGEGRLVFHELDALPLSRHQSAHLGWFEVLEGDARRGWGTCTLVLREQLDGTRRIRWLVATASPEA